MLKDALLHVGDGGGGEIVQGRVLQGGVVGLPIEVLVAGAEGVGEIADIGAVGGQLSVKRQEDIQCLLWSVGKEGECLLLFEPCGVGLCGDA